MKEDKNYDTLTLLHFYPKMNYNFSISQILDALFSKMAERYSISSFQNI